MRYQYLIFDLDNTLYAKNTGMLKYIDEKIDKYLNNLLGLPFETVALLRTRYCERYGTTLGGLVVEHQIDPEAYILQAYGIDVRRFINRDLRLKMMLAQLECKKVVFSNSPAEYVEEVLNSLGVREYFSKIYDIRFCDFLGKPNLSSYRKVVADLGVAPEQCLLVDDVCSNVLGARQIGMDAVWLTGEPPETTQGWIAEIYALEGFLSGSREEEPFSA